MKKIKRMKLLGELLIAFSTNKIILKNLNEKNIIHSHFWEIRRNLIFMKPLKVKKKYYEKGSEYDFKELIKSVKVVRLALLNEFLNRMKEININDPMFKDLKVHIPNEDAFEVKGRNIIIGKNQLEDAVNIVSMKSLKDYDFKIAFITIEDQENILYKIIDRYFLLTFNDFTELMERFNEKLLQIFNSARAIGISSLSFKANSIAVFRL